VLQLQDVHKRYGPVAALDGLDLVAQPGRMLGFLGVNGAGKTTAMRTVFALVRPDSGTVTWNAKPIDDDTRQRFGYMPEQRGLYPRLPLGEQLVYFGRLHGMSLGAARASAALLLEELGLADRNTDKLEALSHGNQQRIQLAVALVHEPDLLVLDEPFSGLDPVGVATMTEVLRQRANNGVAIVFSSHQLDLVEGLCDDVVIIDHGRSLRAGDLGEIRESTGSRVVEAQFDTAAGLGRAAALHAAFGNRSDPPSLGEDPGRLSGDVWRWTVPATLPAEEALRTLTAHAPVRTFTYRPPSLQELFREVVGR
jgi:ABC-2 type transport system ATP-binding protein